MSQLSTQDLMIAAAWVFGLAIACQVIAPRLRIPALVLLLPAGFLLGYFAPQFRADAILGTAFPVVVDLVVAVILFQGGMELGAIPLAGKDRTVVRRMVGLGAPLTGLAAMVAAYVFLGFEWPLAVMLGTILIVSGPTVVTPILELVRPKPRIRGVLLWEGTLLDPIGGLAAVVVFQVIKASSAATPVDGIVLFIGGLLTAALAASLGTVLLILGGRMTRGNALLSTQVLLGSVLVAAALADAVADESGLLTALLMGFTAPRIAKRFGASIEPAQPFFSTIVSFSIGVLFIAISALVPASSLSAVLVPALLVTLVLVLVVRPAVVGICTSRSGFMRREQVFMSWMYPRGIVAAATASSVGAALIALKVPGAADLLPAAFVIIAATVTLYGITAAPLASLLGVREPSEAPSPPPPQAAATTT